MVYGLYTDGFYTYKGARKVIEVRISGELPSPSGLINIAVEDAPLNWGDPPPDGSGQDAVTYSDVFIHWESNFPQFGSEPRNTQLSPEMNAAGVGGWTPVTGPLSLRYEEVIDTTPPIYSTRFFIYIDHAGGSFLVYAANRSSSSTGVLANPVTATLINWWAVV